MDFLSWSEGIPEAAQPAFQGSPGPTLNVPVADSFWTAAGYREIDVTYTCVPDPAYPWDPAIMKQILEFAPDAVPLWVRWVFMGPDDDIVVFGRHGLGRHIKGLKTPPHEFHCPMPQLPCQGLKFEQPNLIWFIHEGVKSRGPDASMPGEYLPFDRTLLWKARESSLGFTMSEKEYKEHLWKELWLDPKAKHDAAKQAQADDMEARRREIAPYVERALWDEYQLSQREIEEVFHNEGPTP
jgi:hypothetical protein